MDTTKKLSLDGLLDAICIHAAPVTVVAAVQSMNAPYLERLRTLGLGIHNAVEQLNPLLVENPLSAEQQLHLAGIITIERDALLQLLGRNDPAQIIEKLFHDILRMRCYVEMIRLFLQNPELQENPLVMHIRQMTFADPFATE